MVENGRQPVGAEEHSPITTENRILPTSELEQGPGASDEITGSGSILHRKYVLSAKLWSFVMRQ